MTLPFDFHRTAGAERQAGRFDFDLPADAGEAPLTAAFAVLLFRYGGQPGVVLDAARFGAGGQPRWRAALTIDTSADASCRGVLAQTAALLSRMDRGFSAAVEAEHPDLGRAAVTFLESELSPAAPRGEDLQLVLAAGRSGLKASFLYNARLFKPATIARAAGHLRELAARMAAQPDARISSVPLLTPEERGLIEASCDGRPRAALPALAHRAFEARAAAAPNALAVRHRDRELTYAQLDARANALARRLLEEGAGPETRVAVCLEPSLDLPVALLAILKAGAVYVPLDPTHPEARLRLLLEDLRPPLLLTRPRFASLLTADGTAALAADDLQELSRGFSGESPAAPVTPDQTASIYFTSGTTGAPKGAMASQANLAAYLASARERYAIGPSDVMPAIARFTFSISMFELMAPLTAGAALLILDREHVLDLERLAKTLEEVTIFHAGPSLLKALTAHIAQRYDGFSAFAGVRHASSGGDMIPPELLESLKRIFSRAEVFVIYGCTEISCMGLTYPVPRDRVVERTFVGRPFDGVSVRLLDAALNPVPVGVVGEIWFGGDGVVQGYLNRPDLTAQRFVERDGRRFYRTGDQGRLSEDGWMEILGRGDYQVKLRGIRVELGEIEHHLRRAEGVRDGVVMPMTLAGGETGLVAYFVPDPGSAAPHAASQAAIRRHLALHLPEYMVPSAFVELEKLPLNHNMKLDRAALPAPPKTRRAEQSRVRPPRTELETKLAAIWTRLLGLDAAGLDDHFFDLGGHSLLGLQLIVEVERELGVTLKGLDLVRESLEGLAALCGQRLGLAPAAEAAGSGRAAPEKLTEAFHFADRGELYGTLAGSALETAEQAVLICPPLGQDHHRAHFILRRLAERLAARGVPSLRFDYYGCGDSLGESVDAGPSRWREDIRQAHRELARRAPSARIAAVGVRLGATLLAEAADDLDLAALVLWDPVWDGARWFEETAATHETFVGRWRRLFRPPPPPRGAVELLGLTCSDAAAAELRALAIARAKPGRPPLKWLASGAPDAPRRAFEELARGRDGSRLETLDFDPGWTDAQRLGDILPDLGVSKALAALAEERP